MKLILILILIPAIGITRSIHKFNIPQCNKYGIKCLDKNTFTFCSTSTQFIIIQVDGLKCPYGYMCQEASQYPCTLDPKYNFDENGCIPTSTTTPEFVTLTEPTNTSAQVSVTAASETVSNTNTESYETTIFKTTTDIQDYSIDNAETTTSTRTSSSLDFITSSISEGTAVPTTTLLSTSIYDSSTSTYPTSTTEGTLSTSEFPSERTSVGNKTSNTDTDSSSSLLRESTTMKLSSDSEEETSTAADNTITKTTIEETSTSFVFTSPEDTNEMSTNVVTKTTVGEYSSTVSTADTTKISTDESSPSISTFSKFVTTTLGTTASSEGDRTSSKSTSLRPTRQPVGPPTCSNYGLYPGPTCNQYYECEMYWLLWYIPVLKSCPTGQSFSTTKSLCVPSSESNCID